jgi:hypothetical protein
VSGQVLVSLLVSGVFGDVVKVFSADDESSVHLGGNNGSSEDTATDGDETSEWALLVYYFRVSFSWGKKIISRKQFQLILSRRPISQAVSWTANKQFPLDCPKKQS